jgi:hypothetical protein
LVLLRPIDKLVGAKFANGSFVRMFNDSGSSVRNGFFAYESKFKGGTQIIKKDINNDGAVEIVVAGAGKITVYAANGDDMGGFSPYGEKYKGDVNFDLVDADNDGAVEVVTGPGKGLAPQVKIFNLAGQMLNTGFLAYAKTFTAGVNVAVGDIDGNGTQEIVTGAGAGGGPQVRIFSMSGKLINPGFFAYGSTWRTGVNVALGDVNGDGRDEIITGPGVKGWPQIKVFNKKGEIVGAPFFAFADYLRDGVKVAAMDIDDNGRAEIIATTTNVFTLAGF